MNEIAVRLWRSVVVVDIVETDMAADCVRCYSEATGERQNCHKSKMIKILCLHGYRQSGEIFKQKLGALRKALKKHAELFFVTAPNKILSAEDTLLSSDDAQKNDQYSWWFSTENMTFDSKKASDVCLGFEKSLSLIEKTFEEQGPFDGLLGFSQGAAFVGILCGMQETNWLKYEFNFAIMVAGFKSLCHPHLNYYFKESSIPSLHVYGENDNVISREMSELLLEQFVHAEVICHPGGHFVPTSGPQRQGYTSFLEERIRDIENENRRKQKQFQVGSYTLERIEDSGSDHSEDDQHKCFQLEDQSDIVCEGGVRTKANKGGISKQTRRKMMQSKV